MEGKGGGLVEYVFSWMNFAFGGLLMLYALILRLTKDVGMIPRMQGVKVDNPKQYAKKFSHLLFFIALAFLNGAWVALYTGPVVGAVVLALSLAAAIWLCVRLWRK